MTRSQGKSQVEGDDAQRTSSAAQGRVPALLALGSAPAAAIELEDGKLSLNGFGSWAYGASDRNDFLVARHTGHFDSGDFALALTSNLISGGTLAVHAEETKYIVGGRLIVSTPLAGLEVRLSAYAHNGREAPARAQTEKIDVILMDVQMPEMDGLVATAAIRHFEAKTGKRVPIVGVRCASSIWPKKATLPKRVSRIQRWERRSASSSRRSPGSWSSNLREQKRPGRPGSAPFWPRRHPTKG